MVLEKGHRIRSVRGVGLVSSLTRAAATRGVPRRALLRVARSMPAAGEFGVRVNGIHFDLDPRDNVQRELLYLGSYEPALSALLRSELQAGDTFLDIGAHVGVHSLPAARSVQPGQVIAFEPAPDAAAKLRHAKAVNELQNLLIVTAALGSKPARQTLRSSPEWDHADQAVRTLYGDGAAVAEVSVLVFDDWFQGNRLDVVKLDIEGGEYHALRGMQNTLRKLRPRLLVLEVVPSALAKSGVSTNELAALTEELGYEPVGPSISEVATGRTGPLWPNVALQPRPGGVIRGSIPGGIVATPNA
jgi:FkbM family methyltransferase